MKPEASGFILAAALGLLSLCLIGYEAFPFVDDFAYGPLAEFGADPSLFPRDDQLRLFGNHAQVYEWAYRLGKMGAGVEPTFRVAVWLLAAAASVALFSILRSLQAPASLLPVALGIGVLVHRDGLGRGDFGGLIAPFFHHHNVALALVLGSAALALSRRHWLAGVVLGVAAYAQPMTALHGALVIGLGAFARGPLEALKIGIAAAAVALPAALSIFGALLRAPEAAMAFDLVKDAYRFRAPHHYDPTWPDIGLATLYVLAGFSGAALLLRSDRQAGLFALGAMGGLAALHLVTVLVYKLGVSGWIGFFILDANRASPVAFVLGPTLALAGLWRGPRERFGRLTALILLVLLMLNAMPAGIAFAALGAVLLAAGEGDRARGARLLAAAAALFIWFPPPPGPPALPEETRKALERVRAETPQGALFVIPVGLSEFRHFAQRSVYVDFKLFSVAQPEQAALTRARLEEVARPAPDHRGMAGWAAARLWEEDQMQAADCGTMAATLRRTKSDYYVRRFEPGQAAPECPGLPRPISTRTLAVYGPAE